MSWLARERIIAGPGFVRWLIPPAALAAHLCIGQVYATSVYKTQLVKYFNVDQTAIGIIFSIAIVMLGLSSAVMGTWVDRNGPRKAMFTAACFWGAGFMVGAVGVFTGQLWLLYLGYGVIGGIGLGIGYISPVSTLMKWFPDHPGLATGLAIMGFGGGALIASPVESALLKAFGAEHNPGAAVGKMFIVLGIVYFLYMVFGSWLIRVPADGWKPAGFNPASVKTKEMVTTANVSANNAIRTPQFWLLWVALFCNITAGIGVLEEAAPMIQDFFRHGSASAITAAAAAGFVGLLSLGNMLGRLGWSSFSDVIGRKRMYMIYLGVGAIIYVLLILLGHSSTALFVIFALIIISFYGGGFSTAPAYLRDLFGTYQVGAIHGRLLTAWSVAGVVGPLIVNSFLDHAHKTGHALNAAAYYPAFITMICILVVGFIANAFIRPVNSKFFEPAK